MERFVTLRRLPDNVCFPEDLQPRIGYDATQQRLWHRGFMSKTEYDRLFALSADLEYQQAIQELFTTAVAAPVDSTPRWWTWVAATSIGLLASGALLVGLLSHFR